MHKTFFKDSEITVVGLPKRPKKCCNTNKFIVNKYEQYLCQLSTWRHDENWTLRFEQQMVHLIIKKITYCSILYMYVTQRSCISQFR